MTPETLVDIIRNTLFTALQVSTPLLLVSMIVGFTISIFQSVTQINEMTLTFVPKVLIFTGTLILLFPWLLKMMMKFTTNILVNQWDKIATVTTYTT